MLLTTPSYLKTRWLACTRVRRPPCKAHPDKTIIRVEAWTREKNLIIRYFFEATKLFASGACSHKSPLFVMGFGELGKHSVQSWCDVDDGEE